MDSDSGHTNEDEQDDGTDTQVTQPSAVASSATGRAPTKSTRGKRAAFWEGFTEFVDAEGVKKAKCHHCEKAYKSVVKYKAVFARMEIPCVVDGVDLGSMTDSDWIRIESLAKFLQGFFTLTNRVSGSLYVTSNYMVFHIGQLAMLLSSLIDGEDIDMALMAVEMKKKFDKYFGNIHKVNLMMFVPAILFPYHKLRGVTNVLKAMFGEDNLELSVKSVKEVAYKLFDDYRTLHTPVANQASQSSHSEETSWIDQFRDVSYDSDVTMRSEFDLYLGDRLEPENTDALMWWKQNELRYPVLALMARDVLAIPISIVPSESAFSTGGRTISDFRSSLITEMVQAIVCTQDWLRAGTRNAKDVDNDEDSDDEDECPAEVLQSTFYACS